MIAGLATSRRPAAGSRFLRAMVRGIVGGVALLGMTWHAAIAADRRDSFEARFGAGAHGVGSPESGSVALNAELVFPRLKLGEWSNDPVWNFLIPRFHVGGVANLSGRTSYLYAGGLWTWDVTPSLFLEGFLGGTVHDGSLLGSSTMSALGCRALIHSGGSLGYQIAPQWSVMLTYDHISNGKRALNACPRNQGLHELLLRVGYSFP
jgi:hypothetical protein